MNARILIVDDEQSQCEDLAAGLSELGCECATTTSPQQALQLLTTNTPFDTVLTDLGMTELNGLELCDRILRSRPTLPVVVVTGKGNMETAVAAMRAGAYDFLTKPVDLEMLRLCVSRAVTHHQLRAELRQLRDTAEDTSGSMFISGSAQVQQVLDLIARVAPSEASVLIQGETGTGKELVARSIHEQSGRGAGPFVAINCAAVPASLLESELFGHTKGAFTDAKEKRQGLFVQASNGTLFLDEIGDMPLDMQAKLLRVLQERRVRPIGGATEIPFDARILAATHRDLDAEVHAGRFRQDLFYRINVVRIDVPSLRERGSDVLKLTEHFLAKAAARLGRTKLSIAPETAEKLLQYDWPGNIRELENCIERVVTLARGDCVVLDDLPENIRSFRRESFVVSADDPGEILTLVELERRYVLRVLKLLGDNKTRAARSLGVDRRTLHRKLRRFLKGNGASHADDSDSDQA
ncbi:MAG: sigma-54-dependent transcriptional regulator [Polyangiales bacterium]